MILTYKYQLKGKRTVRQLRRFAWAVNQVWNYCVQTQRKIQRTWKDGLTTKWLSKYDMQHLTVGTSGELHLHAQSIQGVSEKFTKSRDQHKKCPRFRRSGGAKRSLGWIPFQQQSRQVDGNAVTYLGNTYRFFGAKRRPLPSTAKGGEFVEDARGRWWVCFHVEVNDLPKSPEVPVGIDLGLHTLATLSTGEKIDAPRTYRKYEEKLAIAQRAGRKDRVKVIHAKIANVRRDHLHKATAKIAAEHGTIFVGDVSSSRLAGTRMAKSIHDAGWYAFKNALRYKASRHGGTLVEVDEKWSTQICSSCGELPTERPKGIADLGMRTWSCSSCGAHHDRDVNAARNILMFGRSVTPPCRREAGLPNGR